MPNAKSAAVCWAWLAPSLAALALFAPILSFGFVFDDTYVITDRLRAASLAEWLRLLSPAHAPEAGELTWRPLATATYAAVYAFAGVRPAAHHAVDWLLHALTTLLLARLLLRLGLRPAAAAFGAGVFALHPLVAGTTAMISFREEPLAGALGLGGLLRLTRQRPAHLGGLSLLAAAPFAKETGVAFGPLAAWWPGWSAAERWRRAAPALILSGLAVGALLTANRWTGGLAAAARLAPLSAAARLAAAGETTWAYAAELFDWRRLSPLHDDLVYAAFGGAGAFIGLGLLAGLAGASLYGLARPNRWSLAAALVLGPLAPTLNLAFTQWTSMADRLCYLPMLGVGLAAGAAADRLAAATAGRGWRRRGLAAGLVLLLLALAWGTWRETPRYRNEWTLYSSIAARQPDSPLGQYYFAQELLGAGRATEAERLLRPLYEKHPERLAIAKHLALAALMQGRPAETIALLEAREFAGRDGIEALLTLQRAYLAVGRNDEVEAIAAHVAAAPEAAPWRREAFAANARVARERAERLAAQQRVETGLDRVP